jgi:uncharacterized membrane protein
MSKISSAKLLGGIGAILMIVGWVVPLGLIVGLILLFVAVRYIADETKDSSIFDDYLMHFIFTVIAIVAISLLLFIAIGGFSFVTAVQSLKSPTAQDIWALIEPHLLGIITSLLIGWVFFCIGAWYLRKSYDKVAEHTKVGLFKTTALIYFIGALTVIVAIGFLIIIIAKIIEIIAYFSLPDELSEAKKS